jgi:predicted nuclease of predicted toxin-antitoxin system
VLLDEGVPRQLAKLLADAGCSATAYPNDWKRLKNGELLALAESNGFDVLITNDKNISFQQNLRGRRLAIIVLPTNRLRLILDRAAAIVDTIIRIQAGQCVAIEMSGRRLILNDESSAPDGNQMPPLAPFDV